MPAGDNRRVSAVLAALAALDPGVLAELPRSFAPYAWLMMLGFVVGITGHLTRSRWLVAIGVLLIFIGAFLLPLALKATTNDEPPPPPRVTG
jgi:CHASE2 domain-containing sensor protein